MGIRLMTDARRIQAEGAICFLLFETPAAEGAGEPAADLWQLPCCCMQRFLTMALDASIASWSFLNAVLRAAHLMSVWGSWREQFTWHKL